ncbi:alpha/beta fold hydrolase [Nocardia sp. NPDC049149]|uniref:alpha/beta fold hydrolase n=1 Tax=Nocardia sp. NPDC049149 TaxID=3364315 RepID=UPI00371B2324
MSGKTQVAAEFQRDAVRSDDGTLIGYRWIGHGPGLVLVHGAMMTSELFEGLALALAADFTVYVPDRRGRGMSGPFGPNFGIETEIADLSALVRETNAPNVFGLSSGAAIALCTALAFPRIDKLALYEPPLVVDGAQLSLHWAPRYLRELGRKQLAAALVTVFKGTADRGFLASVPRFLLVPAIALALRLDKGGDGRTALRDLVPTVRYDIEVVRGSANVWDRLAGLRPDVLLLGGSRSAGFLAAALDRLQAMLPDVVRVTLPDVGHTASFNDEKPELVAAELRRFFA